MRFLHPIILEFYTGYNSGATLSSVTFQNVWVTEKELSANEISRHLELRYVSEGCPILHKAVPLPYVKFQNDWVTEK